MPSSTVGRQAPAPTPSRSGSTRTKRACPAPGVASTRGLVAVVARLRHREDLTRITGSSGAPVACGAVLGAIGGPSRRRGKVLAASPGAALQPATVRVEDLEEHHRSAVVLQVDREGALRSAAPSDFTPATSHEDLARGGDRNLCPGRRSVAVGMLQP